MLLKFLQPLVCDSKALAAFKAKGASHHSYREDAHVPRNFSNNGGTTGTGTATHACAIVNSSAT